MFVPSLSRELGLDLTGIKIGSVVETSDIFGTAFMESRFSGNADFVPKSFKYYYMVT